MLKQTLQENYTSEKFGIFGRELFQTHAKLFSEWNKIRDMFQNGMSLAVFFIWFSM